MDSIESQKYTTYEERLCTFNEWPSDKPQIQAELAEVGFWYTGENDRTKCFCCQLELEDWEPNDSPLQIHEYWSSKCNYLKNNKGIFTKFPKYKSLESRSNTFDVLSELKANVKTQLADAGFFYNGKDNETLCFHCGIKLPNWETEDKPWNKHLERNSNCKYLTNNSEKFIQFPNYQSYESRLSTFDTWPTSKSQTKEQLAEAGIFYNRNSNETCCFYCGKDLKNWHPNDVPWLKHFDLNPKCEFVKNRQNLVVYPLYQNTESRLNTFGTWPTSKSKIKEPLAEAGFFYTGKSDTTICFHCGLELQDWTMKCDPDVRHISQFYMCKNLLQRI
ncbi:PREDICTED: E3 ubiquitin-protein ligase XIAP-like [Polistes dominula]|uniref:E3 ubiquitin-protein ligase XIAP-like n=1 Tax=Polistes dominula TaxID=743375 RepID=A0ABM1JGJ9_POLDO|nr:PREDICTED: E3 ubiquitin-protein ligase XIAP-like [Polistes dominula]